MPHRTTLLLDDEAHAAARELASRLDCSVSEVVRRALIRYRELSMGVPADQRKRRTEALQRLFELFDGHDAEAEIGRRKSEDPYF